MSDDYVYNNNGFLQSNKIVFCDIDFTLVANPWETTNKIFQDKKLINLVRKSFEKSGFVFITSTSRTEEMMMTPAAFQLSVEKYNFKRPYPRFYTDNVIPTGILDPDIIISSSGAKISVKQKNKGYATDYAFYANDFPDPVSWRKIVFLYLQSFQSKITFKFAEIEFEKNFQKRLADIYPADYRIQLNFSAKEQLVMFLEKFMEKKSLANDPAISGLTLTIDSFPQQNKHVVYITPKKGKTDAMSRVTKSLSMQWQIPEKEMEILVVGDSYIDFEAGLSIDDSKYKQAVLFLVGGSRLFPYLTQKDENDFGGIDLSSIKTLMKRDLSQSKGIYQYNKPGTKGKVNIILADEAFPQSVGPKSIIEFFHSKLYNYLVNNK